MKSYVLPCSAALLAGTLLISQGVSEENLTFFAPQSEDDGALAPLESADVDVVELAPTTDLRALREQYLDAARQRASLMDEAALREAIATESKMVDELRAQQALLKVEQQLQQISVEYAETAAGDRARRLLIRLEATEDRGPLMPEPDDRFRDTDDFNRRHRGDRFNRSRSDYSADRDEPDFLSDSPDDSSGVPETIPESPDLESDFDNGSFDDFGN